MALPLVHQILEKQSSATARKFQPKALPPGIVIGSRRGAALDASKLAAAVSEVAKLGVGEHSPVIMAKDVTEIGTVRMKATGDPKTMKMAWLCQHPIT